METEALLLTFTKLASAGASNLLLGLICYFLWKECKALQRQVQKLNKEWQDFLIKLVEHSHDTPEDESV